MTLRTDKQVAVRAALFCGDAIGVILESAELKVVEREKPCGVSAYRVLQP
jgi:hypothetical protein